MVTLKPPHGFAVGHKMDVFAVAFGSRVFVFDYLCVLSNVSYVCERETATAAARQVFPLSNEPLTDVNKSFCFGIKSHVPDTSGPSHRFPHEA